MVDATPATLDVHDIGNQMTPDLEREATALQTRLARLERDREEIEREEKETREQLAILRSRIAEQQAARSVSRRAERGRKSRRYSAPARHCVVGAVGGELESSRPHRQPHRRRLLCR